MVRAFPGVPAGDQAMNPLTSTNAPQGSAPQVAESLEDFARARGFSRRTAFALVAAGKLRVARYSARVVRVLAADAADFDARAREGKA